MKTFIELTLMSILTLTCCSALGQGQAVVEHNKEVLNELVAQLPKGTIKHGRDLPLFMKDAIKELARVSSGNAQVETLYTGVFIITDMDQYLDLMKVTSPTQRDMIKNCPAFTKNRQWPIYINGQSDVFRTALNVEHSSSQNPYVYEFVAVLWHELVHIRDHGDEVIAVQGEIEILENLYRRGLVKLECVNASRVKLAQILKGQVPRGPIELGTYRH